MPVLSTIVTDELFSHAAEHPDNELEGYLLLMENGDFIEDEGGFGVFALDIETSFVLLENGSLLEHEDDFDTVLLEAQ